MLIELNQYVNAERLKIIVQSIYIALNTFDENHFKACWIIKLFERQLHLLQINLRILRATFSI
jgi:hypothetical protein